MRTWLALYRKEFTGYFYSLLSYIFIIVFVVVLAWLFWQNVFLVGQVSMRNWFVLLPWFFLFLLPALAMRLWSEEKKQGTIETVLTLPLSDWQAVVAKFSAASSFVAIVLLLSLPIPITLARLGDLDWGPVVGSYIGAWLMGSSIVALGQWLSSLTKNQIIAFLVTIAVTFILLVIGSAALVSGTGLMARTLYTLSLQTHFQNFAKGVIDLRDVIYYCSLVAVCLYLNVYSLRQRHVLGQATGQVGLVIASAVVLNIALGVVTWRADLTDTKQYTLSDASAGIVEQLSNPVTMKLYFSEAVPQNMLALRQDVIDLLTEYKQTAGDQVILEVIDPKQDTSAQTALETYGIPEIQFNVVGNESFEVSTGYAGLVMVYQDTSETIPVISDTTTLEYDISAAIQKMSRTSTPTIGWLSDHGVAETTTVQQYFGQQYTVTPVTLDALPPDVITLVVVGPTKPFTDAEQYTIDQFIMRGGSLIVLLDGTTINEQFLQATANSTGLEQLLQAYGMTVNSDIVADFASAETLPFGGSVFTVLRPYPVWPVVVAAGLNLDHPITASIQSFTLPWPSSLSVAAVDDITITELAKSSPQSYSYPADTIVYPDALEAPSESALEQKVLAALVSGQLPSAFTAETLPAEVDASQFIANTTAGQVLVVGNARFVSDQLLDQSVDNAILLLNAVDALTQETALMSIRSRAALDRPIAYLTDTQKVATKYTNIFSGVVLVIVLAGLSYGWRRRLDRKAKQHYA